MSTSFLYAALGWMAYLHSPPPSSWVVRAAATFRVLALLLILPCIFLTALDVASYLVVRTLGADSAHRLEPVNGASDYSHASNIDDPSPGPTLDEDSQNPPTIVIPPQFDAAPGGHQKTYFATLSDGNFALSGEGIFSPPESRSSSPPITRHPRNTSLPSGTAKETHNDGEGAAMLRKRA